MHKQEKNDDIRKNIVDKPVKPKQYCNNCGNSGHILYQCKLAILSIGVIAFRWNPIDRRFEYLMIRRKDTFGYVDFIRGKYTLDNKEYLLRMFRQMTVNEKTRIMSDSFDNIWRNLWGKAKTSVQYRMEETGSFMRFQQLIDGSVVDKCAVDKESGIRFTMADLIAETNLGDTWQEQEWGFPKGRRNTQEMDYNCALREMSEETGFPTSILRNVHNIMPFEETFIGSNNKNYKHRYYLMYMDYAQSLGHGGNYQRDEVSGLDWFSYEDCLARIRPYNVEKLEMLLQVHTTITKYGLYI